MYVLAVCPCLYVIQAEPAPKRQNMAASKDDESMYTCAQLIALENIQCEQRKISTRLRQAKENMDANAARCFQPVDAGITGDAGKQQRPGEKRPVL